MPKSEAGSSRDRGRDRRRSPPFLRSARGWRAACGFTLLELLVVLSIIAIATAGVALSLRDSASTLVQREAERLAALLESGRAQSRVSGVAVVWRTTPAQGFGFDGLPSGALPHDWLDRTTRSLTMTPVTLGPEPIIAPQEIVLTSARAPDVQWRVWTDGLRPFVAQPGGH